MDKIFDAYCNEKDMLDIGIVSTYLDKSGLSHDNPRISDLCLSMNQLSSQLITREEFLKIFNIYRK